MRFQTILVAAFCMFGFAQSSDCTSRFSEEDLTQVNSIANELNVTSCVAADVFDYLNEGHKFSYHKSLTEEECQIGCMNEANQKLQGLDKSAVDELLTICENNCFLENIEVNNETESELVNFEKRGNVCDPISSAKVSVVSNNYKFGYKKYQDAGSKKTALSLVNGCGPKQAVFGIDNESIKKIPLLLDGTFEPACNMHDICYACQKGKSTCDTRLKNGIVAICNKKFPPKSQAVKNTGCKAQANIFYALVAAGGKNAYNAHPVNTSDKCAACGVPVIKNTLVKTPFYKK